MSNEPSVFSDTSGSNLPDKPLIVKCNSNLRPQKFTFVNFRSARNCTYDNFQEKIRKHFGLTEPFTIQWQDDKKDWYSIHDETSLFMAIDFYHSRDKSSTTPSGSLFKFRSSSRHPKITMLVEICVDHGLNLSKTSVASRDDYSPEENRLSFLELSSSQDDDAVTVSSTDTRGPKGKDKDDSSLLKKFRKDTSRATDNSSSNEPQLKPSRARSFTLGSRASTTEEEIPRSSLRVRPKRHSSDSLVKTASVESYPHEPLAVLERLKLDQPILETMRGRKWLQNQNIPQKAVLGAAPSMSEDSFLPNTESLFSEEISHQKDERGKSDHNFTSFGSSKSTKDLEDEAVNEVPPSKLQVLETAQSLNFATPDNATPHLLVKPPSRTNQGLNSRSKRSNVAETFDNADEPFKHPGVQCSNCQQDIVGARFHCINCLTVDINMCSNCEMAGLSGNLDAFDGGHNSSHIMLKIPIPLSMHEVQQFFRAYAHRYGDDRTDLGGSPSLEVCNSCNKPITGIRYQCLNCPSKPNSINLCSDCEIKSYKVHDPMHTFLKIPRPVDNPGPLQSEFPIIPVLYQDPAGPAPGTPAADISGDPAAYLRDLKHTFALCDWHMMPIVGKWYRCAFCAKDLCADCEEIDTHDNTHVFLVFKAPVDMQAFRHFADLESPNDSPPVLRGAVYYPT